MDFKRRKQCGLEETKELLVPAKAEHKAVQPQPNIPGFGGVALA